MDRRTVVLELVPEGEIPTIGDRGERLQAAQRLANAVKERVVGKLEKLRPLDPKLQVESKETIFPVLVVTTTSEVLDRISRDPDVKGVAPATDFRTAV